MGVDGLAAWPSCSACEYTYIEPYGVFAAFRLSLHALALAAMRAFRLMVRMRLEQSIAPIVVMARAVRSASVRRRRQAS